MIGAIGASSATTQVTQPSRHPRPDMTKAMQPAADLLGTDVASLQEQLKGGSTLREIAADKGIDRQALLDAIGQGLRDAKPAEAPEPPEGFAEIAEHIADGTRPQGAPPGRPPGGSGDGTSSQDRLSTLAELLGTDEASLLEQLKSGLGGLEDLLGSTATGAYGQDRTWSLRSGLGVDTTA